MANLIPVLSDTQIDLLNTIENATYPTMAINLSSVMSVSVVHAYDLLDALEGMGAVAYHVPSCAYLICK